MVIKFLKKTLLMFSLIAIVVGVYVLIYKYQISKIKINKNIHILVCGDSHTQSAINDKVLNRSINVSQSSEPYLASYNVIRTLTNNNPQIKTIVLGYSFHSLSNFYDDVVYKEKYKVDFYARYLPILDFESIKKISNHNFRGLIKSFPKSLNTWITLKNLPNINEIDYKNFIFFGNYYLSKTSDFNEKTIKSSIQRHYFELNRLANFSIIQEKYLEKIVKLCAKKNVKLYLINTPISNDYLKKIPKKFIIKYYNTIQEIGDKAILIDFHDLKLKNYCYGDGDHINAYGAKILSLKLDSIYSKLN